jgi:CRP-like cAMP-binding protein
VTYFAATNPSDNILLRTLSPADRDRLLPHLQLVTLSLGQVILECHQRIDVAYFLTGAVVSLVYTAENGSTAEMAIIGNDGIVGTSIFLGGDSTCSRAVVAVAGQALQMSACTLRSEFERNLQLQRILLGYTQALITQISQTAVCNRLHSIAQRLCRWLLLCQDGTGSAELKMTQELIAHMLGGRRESVTVAAGHLQDLGLIHYCRGRIHIIDRKGLEACACECYRTVKEELARLHCSLRPQSFKPPAPFQRAV